MNLPDELKFKDEDERIATIEQYENDGGSDVGELQRIADAPVDVPDEIDPEDVVESLSEPEVPVATEAPADPPAQPDGQGRSWSVTEDDISKDTYYDKKEGKVRPFITQKNFGDMSKSYISGQKRIHYLEDVLLPQEREAVKAEFGAEVDRLKAEVAQLKTVPLPTAAEPGPVAQPAKPTGDASTDFATALADLKAVDPNDAIEHTDKLHKALIASMAQTSSINDRMSELQQSTSSTDTRFKEIESARQAETDRLAAATRSNQAETNWKNACGLVDTFAQTSSEFKEEFGQLGQSFESMSKDSMDFHISLAGLMFNKHPQQATKQEVDAATQSYLNGNEQLKTQAAQYGLDEPQNYRAWLELDQVDAMRTGLYRDPASKQWLQTLDPVTKTPVMLGDMGTAYGRYLDVSGKRNVRTQALLKKQQESLTGAIARRDTGIVSMDTNRLHSDGSGADMTEAQAVEIAESTDGSVEMGEYLRTGNKSKLELLNRALDRLGAQPLEIPDLDDMIRKPAEQ